MLLRSLLALNGLVLTATGGVLYLNLGGWTFLTSCFVGMVITVCALWNRAWK